MPGATAMVLISTLLQSVVCAAAGTAVARDSTAASASVATVVVFFTVRIS
jgi:hypothetical protein